MVEEDFQACKLLFTKWNSFSNSTFLLLSPNAAQVTLISNLGQVRSITEAQWDLNCATDIHTADIIIACNVFHYAKDPALWFKNVLARCKEFWLQDLCIRYRGINGLGTDGDKMRYTYNHPCSSCFDLTFLGDRVLDFYAYDAGSFKNKRLSINFVARIRGEL